MTKVKEYAIPMNKKDIEYYVEQNKYPFVVVPKYNENNMIDSKIVVAICVDGFYDNEYMYGSLAITHDISKLTTIEMSGAMRGFPLKQYNFYKLNDLDLDYK